MKGILDHLVTVGPSLITSFCKPGPHCVLATAVGQMVLARFGIEAEAYPVAVAVCNRAWIRWKADGHPGGKEEQQRRGAWLVSNNPDWKGETVQLVKSDAPWDGHLVLRVRDGVQTWLVDLDLGSFNRPQHAIMLPGGLVAPLSSDGVVSGTFTDGRVETAVEYGPLVAPYRDDYLTAKDWTRRARLYGHVDALVEAMIAAVPRGRRLTFSAGD